MKGALLVVLAACAPCAALDLPRADKGSIQLTLVPKKDRYPAGKDMVLFSAVTADGSQRFEVHLIAEDFLAVRQFAGCIRSATRIPHELKAGKPRTLALRWNGPTTKLFVDGVERDPFDMMIVDSFGAAAPSLRTGADPDWELASVSVTGEGLPAAAPDDLRFLPTASCPRPKSLLRSEPQESAGGIALKNFPDQKSRAVVRAYIAELPADAADVIQSVVFVPKKYNPSASWKGQAHPGEGAILVVDYALESPSTFFHEAAHLRDFAAYRAGGELKSAEWARRFMARETKSAARPDGARPPSVLDEGDAMAPHEQLADFVGRAYEAYLSEKLPPADWREDMNRAKLKWCLDNRFVSVSLYERLTGREAVK